MKPYVQVCVLTPPSNFIVFYYWYTDTLSQNWCTPNTSNPFKYVGINELCVKVTMRPYSFTDSSFIFIILIVTFWWFQRLFANRFIFVCFLKLSIGFFWKLFCKYMGNWDATNIVVDSMRGRALELFNQLGYSASFKNAFVMKIAIQTNA